MAFFPFLLVNRWKKSDFFKKCFSASRDCTGNCARSSWLPSYSLNKAVLPQLAELVGPLKHGRFWLWACSRLHRSLVLCASRKWYWATPALWDEGQVEISLLTSSSFQFPMFPIWIVPGVPQLCPQWIPLEKGKKNTKCRKKSHGHGRSVKS